MAGETLLKVDDLRMHFHTRDGVVKAVDGVSYELELGGTLGIVGESGSGKSVHALTMMRLVPMPPGRVEGGDVLFKGRSLIHMSDDEIRHVRGNEIAMIFQDPMTSLNPVYRVGRQIAEPLMVHRGASKTRGVGQGGRDAAPGGHPEPGDPGARLPSPVLGRDAPARDDRDGVGLRPRHPHRRRADDCARRDHPGADHRADAEAPGADRLGDHHDHARPGRRGRRRGPGIGHVRRQGGRVRAGRRGVLPAACTPTRGACSTRSPYTA